MSTNRFFEKYIYFFDCYVKKIMSLQYNELTGDRNAR